MLALGAASYAAKEYAAGRLPDLSAETLLSEAVVNSGLVSLLPDLYDPIAKIVGAPQFSRYQTRSLSESLTGPTVGTLDDAAAAVQGAFQDGTSQKDISRLRRLLPGQNLFWLRRLVNAIEGEVGEAIGAEDATAQTLAERFTHTKE
jgi:hypothetical protein